MVTMKDVARAAGVSQPAVSYAYNRPDQLSADLRAHILRVAADLSYPGPDPVGRGLRRGSVGAIGLMITDSLPYAFHDPATVELLRGVAEVGELAEMMLTLLPLRSAGGRENPQDVEAQQAKMSSGSLVDGFLVYSLPDRHSAVEAALHRGLPTVVIDAPRVPDVGYVGIRDRQAARQTAEHLLGLGHRRVGVLVDRLSPDGKSGLVDSARRRQARDGVARERVAGYAQALRAAGLTWRDVPLVEAGGFDPASTERAVDLLLDSRHGLSAILASTDVLALQSLRALRARSVAVPDEVSVIGFDDIPEAVTAGLTTMAQPLVEKGRASAQLLLDRIRLDKRSTVMLPTELKVRASTAPPRSGTA
jgi:DNA-binding LacI/PurR family transcriptional regulator